MHYYLTSIFFIFQKQRDVRDLYLSWLRSLPYLMSINLRL